VCKLTRYSLLLTILIVLVFSGCNGSTTVSNPSPVINITTAESPETASIQEAPVSTTPPASASIPAKSDLIIGDPLKEQSFEISFESLGESRFITTEEKVGGMKRPHFYIVNGETVKELQLKLESPDSYYDVSAVSFRDVSDDGKKDIIIIADYTTGFGYMGAIPISQVIIFRQTESGFIQDHIIEQKAHAGVPYRVLTIQDVMTGLKTNPKDSVFNAWKRVESKEFILEGSGELHGSTLTIQEVTRDGLLFRLDAFYAHSKEALDNGGVNTGMIESGKAIASYSDMIFKDGEYELSLYMIDHSSLYVRDNGQPYFGHNVNVNGIYSLK
jgi:hypothetical protein